MNSTHHSRNLSSADVEHLRSTNARLDNTVQELKLEIAYYKGETKRLEWEKNMLQQDVQRMSSLFKSWIQELNQNRDHHIGEEQNHEVQGRTFGKNLHQFNTMIHYPCKPIAELLQIPTCPSQQKQQQSDEIVFATSSQPPHYIEVCFIPYCI